MLGEIARILAAKSGEWAARWISHEHCSLLRPAQSLCFLHWGENKTRVTSDEAQGTMERRKKGGEALPLSFSPFRLPLSANFHRGRGLWVQGSKQCWINLSLGVIFIFITSIAWREAKSFSVHNFNSPSQWWSAEERKTKRKLLSFLSHHDRSPIWLCAVTGREEGGRGGGGVVGWGKDWYKSKTSSFISVSSCRHSWEQPREIDSKRKRVKNSRELLRVKWFCSWSWEF